MVAAHRGAGRTPRASRRRVKGWGSGLCGSNAAGFSLLEVLVAVALLAGALTSLAQLFAIATDANANASRTTVSAVIAAQKMEELRGAGADLSMFSAGSLTTNTSGYCDFFDASGRLLAVDVAPSEGAVYVRRWSVEPLATDAEARVLQVVVSRSSATGEARTQWPGPRLPDETRLVTIKARRDR
jgi:prepilin-type N-terminal cleavage/methylation domain-containing protein